MNKLYKINVDGERIERVSLTRKQYGTQAGLDIVRQDFAKRHGIHIRGVRLVRDESYIVVTDMDTGEIKKLILHVAE